MKKENIGALIIIGLIIALITLSVIFYFEIAVGKFSTSGKVIFENEFDDGNSEENKRVDELNYFDDG